ncbi:MAG: endolytic transglycosylase MltG [Clostridia bacterium]
MRMLLVALVSLAILGLIAYVGYGQVMEALQPPDPEATDLVEFRVEQGASTSDVGTGLSEKGLVRDGAVFSLYARYRGYDGRIQAGLYHLTAAMDPEEILGYLVEGRVSEREFTVPEGLKVSQVIARLVDAGFGTEEEFNDVVSDGGLVKEWVPKNDSAQYPVEGYLLPDTYKIPWDAEPEDIVRRMVRAFGEYMDPGRRKRADELGMSVHEVVTLASIVEREAATAEERGIIAGVFHNRLERGMRLEACATVHYAIGRPDGELSDADLQTESPYNTYRVDGLPPGPIASPGVASLEATLYPEDVPYLYFVAKDDGTHAFAETFAEHQANISRYR